MDNAVKNRRKEKFRKQMKTLLILLLVFTILSAAALLWNLYRIKSNQTGNETLSAEDAGSEYSNDYYSIGNNPTDIDKTYFKELNKAVEADDKAAISEALVKCFVSEYYTWTNKDGTYDIGGIQYIYTERQKDFETYTRNETYGDMDLYISEYGRDRLMQVREVTTDTAVSCGQVSVLTSTATASSTADAEATADASSANETVSYEGYTVKAEWSYEEDTYMNLSSAKTSGTFTVIDHDGRMEIAAME